jgi:hypothetical protein
MKKVIISCILLFFVIILQSCSKLDDKTKTWFCFQLAGNFSETRAAQTVEENSVKNLWVLQFNGTVDGSTLRKAVYLETVPSDLNNVSVPLINGTNQTVYFIANTFDNTLFNSVNAPVNSFSITSLKTRRYNITKESDFVKNYEGLNYLVMSGKYTGIIPNSSASVMLNRASAKIVINYSSNSYSGAYRFKVKSIQLKNVPSTAGFIPDPSSTSLTNPATLINYEQYTTPSLTDNYNIDYYNGGISFYMPENVAGVNASVTDQTLKVKFAPAKATFVEFFGSGVDENGDEKCNVIFKLYMGGNITSNYNLNANTRYNVSIVFNGINISDARIEIQSFTELEQWSEEVWL